MNEKEVAEIRRRFRPDKGNISRIRGCYVNEKKEIVSEFDQSLSLMTQTESEELLAVLKKTLSGTLGKNLLDIEFSTQQVLDRKEYRMLMTIKNSSLDDNTAVQALYAQIIQSISMEGCCLILLANDKYDVPFYSKDGQKQDGASEVFSYILCSICPIKSTKPILSYTAYENKFRSIAEDIYVSSPELGFMFPAFDDRSANIYDALFYTRNIAESHETFIDTVFNRQPPMPAAAQKETFSSLLSDSIAEDCSLDVVQAVHEQFSNMIEEHKANKETDPLILSKANVKNVLKSCGVSEERVTAFEENYNTEFGENTELSPRNIVDTKHFEVRTPDITIRVNPERSDLVDTKIINGIKYIIIRADEGVEVNGVAIHIS